MFRPSAAQVQIMKAALGIPNGETEYRNHYTAGEGHSSWNDLLELERELLVRRVSTEEPGVTFMVTNEGKAFCKGTRKR